MPYVSCSDFNASQAAQNAAIAALQVPTPTGGVTLAQVNAAIAASQTAQDAAISAANQLQDTAILNSVTTTTFNASQDAQNAAIAALQNASPAGGVTLAQVNAAITASQTTQDAAISAANQLQNTAILNSVTTTTFNASQAAQDSAIAALQAANQLQDAAILNNVTLAASNAANQLQDAAILNSVTTTTFNASQAAQDSAIAALQAANAAPSACIALYQYIDGNNPGGRVIVRGLPPNSVAIVTRENFFGTNVLLTAQLTANALGVIDEILPAGLSNFSLNLGERLMMRHPTCSMIPREQSAVLTYKNLNGQGDGSNTDGADSPDGGTDA